MSSPALDRAAVLRELALADGRTVRIRHAVPDDAPALLAFFRQAGAESDYLTFGAEGMPRDEAGERAVIAQLTAAPNGLSIVAEDGGRIVGSMRFEGGSRLRTRHGGEFGVAVLAAYHGTGVGRALVECLIAWAEGSGVIRKLDLRVRADNARAKRLYEAYGWRVEGLITRDILMPDGTFFDAYHMGRPVDPPRA